MRYVLYFILFHFVPNVCSYGMKKKGIKQKEVKEGKEQRAGAVWFNVCVCLCIRVRSLIYCEKAGS